ncbi:hypothetical protein [Pseudomonas sp. MC6]|jgi:hypothetical protein
MKRSVLLGLFVTASMMASASFADGKPADLCQANIQTINNTQLSDKPELKQRADTSVAKAKALEAQGKIDDCIAETSQTIVELRKSTGTNN